MNVFKIYTNTIICHVLFCIFLVFLVFSFNLVSSFKPPCNISFMNVPNFFYPFFPGEYLGIFYTDIHVSWNSWHRYSCLLELLYQSFYKICNYKCNCWYPKKVLFSFARFCQKFFHSIYTNLYSLKQYEVSCFFTSLSTFGIFTFFSFFIE